MLADHLKGKEGQGDKEIKQEEGFPDKGSLILFLFINKSKFGAICIK